MASHFTDAADLLVAKHVWVAAHELIADGAHDVVGPKPALRARELRLEHDLQEQVPELFAQLLRRTVIDGIHDLVCLLDHVRAQGLQRLLAVPRATVRREQPAHDLDQARERTAVLLRQRHGGAM
jgi:hypothetical protein